MMTPGQQTSAGAVKLILFIGIVGMLFLLNKVCWFRTPENCSFYEVSHTGFLFVTDYLKTKL